LIFQSIIDELFEPIKEAYISLIKTRMLPRVKNDTESVKQLIVWIQTNLTQSQIKNAGEAR
jgi:hypothetical protein